MMNVTAVLRFAALLPLLSGCIPSFESTEPADRVYWLETMAIDNPADITLRVSVVPGLDSDRILILEQDQRLNYYASAFWPDTLQTLLQSVMARSLDAKPAGQAAAAIEVTLERFFALESSAGDPPLVEIRARIARSEPAASICLFGQQVTSASARLRDIVAAHQALLDQLTREVNKIAGGDSVSC
jgi:ABC-type uncharacterized transport system auxiliary subunit